MHLCLMPRCLFASIVGVRFRCQLNAIANNYNVNRVTASGITNAANYNFITTQEIARFLRRLGAIGLSVFRMNSMMLFQRCGCSIFQSQTIIDTEMETFAPTGDDVGCVKMVHTLHRFECTLMTAHAVFSPFRLLRCTVFLEACVNCVSLRLFSLNVQQFFYFSPCFHLAFCFSADSICGKQKNTMHLWHRFLNAPLMISEFLSNSSK